MKISFVEPLAELKPSIQSLWIFATMNMAAPNGCAKLIVNWDQAHFTNEFRRMTGFPPKRFFNEIANELGRALSARQEFAFLQSPSGDGHVSSV